MNGAYQQQAMGNQQYSGMIGQGYGAYGGGQGTGQRGDAMMGGMMNRGSAYGAPLLAGAAGLMGLDPMSMGMKVGMGAFAGGAGLGGAALAGGAVALPLMGMVAGAKYAGSQMYSGAQNQMELNNTLRGSFTFQNRTGGQGFGREGMSGIGEMMHGMAQQMGPGGELTSMRELTSLAGKMGTMGFAQGVRDVQDFTKRFKEMTTALKSMAKDLGTTMEGAMEFAAASKGSGVFGMSNMSKFSHAVRGATVAGGLGVSEVTGMANIGSQIARSVGGLGRQGAGAGIRTIGQIGAAQQMGLLSEEDIYNQTGLTGAEGRQAMATSALSKSASFLQSGKGRRMLASIAGKDGTLDEGGIEQLLSGGMTIGQTMQNDKTNLGKIGRANFIRNEGRLRGAAMERLGGFLPAMQLQEWAQGKGIDINNMDDRSMLFAQRQLGMGRDEVDNAVKMANNMPMILEQMRRSEGMDSYFQKQSQQRKTQGLEGIKGRFEHAKQVVNGKLEKVGADIFNQGSESIDRFFNQLFGDYVETYSKDIDSASAAIMGGGATGRGAGQRAFGLGKNAGLRMDVAGAAGRGGVGGPMAGYNKGVDFATQMTRGSRGTLEESFMSDIRGSVMGSRGGGTQGEVLKYLMQGQSGVGKMKDAGFDVHDIRSNAGITAKLKSIEDVQRAVATGYDPTEVGWGVKNKDWLSRAYAMDEVNGKGEKRTQSFGDLLQKHDKTQYAAYQKMSESEKARFMANTERGVGVAGDKSLAANYGMPDLNNGRRGFESEGAENEAYAKSVGGVKRSMAERIIGGALGGAAGAGALMMGALGGIGGVAAAAGLGGKGGFEGSAAHRADLAARGFVSRLFGTAQKEQEMGTFAKSAEYRDLAAGLMSSDPEVRKTTEDRMKDQMNAGTGMAVGQNDVMKGMLAAKDYMDSAAKQGGKLSPDEEEMVARRNGMDVGSLRKATAGMSDNLRKQWDRDLAEEGRRQHEVGSKDKIKLENLGLYDASTGSLSASGEKELRGMGGEAAVTYANLEKRKTDLRAGMGGSAEGNRAALEEINSINEKEQGSLNSMTVADKRKFAARAAGTEQGSAMAYSAAMQDKFDTGMRRKKGNATSVVNDLLGAGLSKDELGSANAAQLMIEKFGLKEGTAADLREALKGQKGGSSAASNALGRVMGSEEVRAAKAKGKMDEAEANDPLSAAIKKNGEKTNELLAKIAISTGQTVDKLDQKDNPDGTDKARGKETGKGHTS